MGRRLNYLWYLLNEEDDTLVRSFLQAQIDSPMKGDWINTVRDNLAHLDINMNMEAVAATSKDAFKTIVKEAITKKALQYLQTIQSSHSKSKNLKYSMMKMQPYLEPSDAKLSIHEKQFIFSARSRMMDLLDNFKTGKGSLLCRACDADQESQPHLLQCNRLSDNDLTSSLPEYPDLFCDDVQKIANIGRLLKTKHEKFKKIINNKPDAPAVSAAASTVIVNNNCNSCIGKN